MTEELIISIFILFEVINIALFVFYTLFLDVFNFKLIKIIREWVSKIKNIVQYNGLFLLFLFPIYLISYQFCLIYALIIFLKWCCKKTS